MKRAGACSGPAGGLDRRAMQISARRPWPRRRRAVPAGAAARRAGWRKSRRWRLGRSDAGRVPPAALRSLRRARAPASARPARAAPAADRRQPCLLARHSRARRDRADDLPGEKGNRRARFSAASRAAAGRRLRRPRSASAAFPRSTPTWPRRCARASRSCCSPRRRPATATGCCASAPRISRRSGRRRERGGGDAVVQPVFLHYSRIAGLPVARADRPMFAWYGDMTFLPHLWRVSSRGRRDLRRLLWRSDPGLGGVGDRKALARATERAVREGSAANGRGRAARSRTCSAIPAAPETG